MTRAQKGLVIAWRFIRDRRFREAFVFLPRVGYCECCGAWTWRTWETPARSTGRSFICEECADENDLEWDAAWREVHSW